jgi:glucokinase
MILAGDIGGSKTVLALFSMEQGMAGGAFHETRYESGKYSSLEAIISEFLDETQVKPVAASFGVAGPVRERQAKITNLPWNISLEPIQSAFAIPHVFLLNDLQAIAVAVPYLEAGELTAINQQAVGAKGNIVVIAPGTGLGVSFLIWTGTGYKACASEAGHSAFSPRNPREIELLQHLRSHYGHVSFERICSGGFFPDVYQFIKETGAYVELPWLQIELEQAEDRTPVIIRSALEQSSEICEATLDIFVHALGTMVSNMAVTFLPTGGIFLGGGIPPRIAKRLQQPDFLDAIVDKGRFSSLVSSMPIHVIMEPKAGLYGAARFGIDEISRSRDYQH